MGHAMAPTTCRRSSTRRCWPHRRRLSWLSVARDVAMLLASPSPPAGASFPRASSDRSPRDRDIPVNSQQWLTLTMRRLTQAGPFDLV